MKAPLSWLKDYVDIDISAQELMQKLFSCGFEVEELIDLGKDISGVVVGEVIECESIEGTHLTICQVDCGEKGTFQICCGADNVKVGIKVPCALVGATVYATAKDHVTVEGVMTIKKGKLRGVESFGMLCSGVELGVNGDMYDGGDYNGLLILSDDAQNGQDVKPILGLDDYIFDISITANRPDCQSILGIAREVAAVLNKPVKEPDYSFTAKKGDYKEIKISDLAPDICPRYIGHYVTEVKPSTSPLWLRKRLALCGLRSISNIVDITNFVLLEMGQPMHAFDLDTLSGREIVVRRAKSGEKIVTLDNSQFDLSEDNLVICDGQRPCALAGIMGGLESEITDNTKEVLFEAAKFARDSVRKTARSLGQHSDSSAAFEKGVTEFNTEMAMKRALHLIEELGCGVVTDIHVDVKTEYSKTEQKTMTVSLKKICDLLGIEIPQKDAVRILTNLAFSVELDGDKMHLKIPRFREDIDEYPDIAEEIIRFYGYENVVGTFMPSAKITNGGLNETQKAERRLKSKFAAVGVSEISGYSFISPKDFDILHFDEQADERKAITILNPISEDLSVMRTTLAPTMVNTIVRNLRRGNMEGKLFEIAKIYVADQLPIKTFPKEINHLSVGIWGRTTFFNLKGYLEVAARAFGVKFDYVPSTKPFLHPGICADVMLGEEKIGYMGMLSPQISEELSLDRPVFVAEIDYDALAEHKTAFKYKPLSKYPVEVRDLALVCDSQITCAEIEREIYAACKYVSNTQLFDIYTGEQIGKDKKSMAFKITFTPKDEPIENKVDGFVKKILANLKFKLNIDLR